MKKWLSSILIALSMVICPLNIYAEKSAYDIAQELLYGQWAVQRSDIVKFDFDDSNVVSIDKIIEADPYGKTVFWCKIRLNGRTYFVQPNITLENNKYYMVIRFTGTTNELRQLDPSYYNNQKFVKVYWN